MYIPHKKDGIPITSATDAMCRWINTFDGGGAGVSPYEVTGLIKSGAGGWAPYQIGRDYLGSITDISDFSSQLFIYRKGGIGEGVPTGYFIFKK